MDILICVISDYIVCHFPRVLSSIVPFASLECSIFPLKRLCTVILLCAVSTFHLVLYIKIYILVTSSDGHYVAKVADFGLSRFLAESEYYKSEESVVAYKWAAPESFLYGKFDSG